MTKIDRSGRQHMEVFVKTLPSNKEGRYIAVFKIAGLTHLPWQMLSQNGNASLFCNPREAIWPAWSAAMRQIPHSN
jgi:hypothetical protein